MKGFGITEAGDASVDYDWEEKLDNVDGTILITKKLTEVFIESVLEKKDKPIIIHVSCTGYGKTPLEPACPKFLYTIGKMRSLIDRGWPSDRLVLRVDPIIPTPMGIARFEAVVKAAHDIIPEVKRVRVSVLDMYPHVRERFIKKGLALPYGDNFQASESQFAALNESIEKLRDKYHLQIESCAEKMLPATEQVGCVSEKDFNILEIPFEEVTGKKQRKSCLCSGNKKELLDYKWNKTGYNHCYGCLYCYWKTEADVKAEP